MIPSKYNCRLIAFSDILYNYSWHSKELCIKEKSLLRSATHSTFTRHRVGNLSEYLALRCQPMNNSVFHSSQTGPVPNHWHWSDERFCWYGRIIPSMNPGMGCTWQSPPHPVALPRSHKKRRCVTKGGICESMWNAPCARFYRFFSSWLAYPFVCEMTAFFNYHSNVASVL